MTISLLTLFPEMFEGPFNHSILKRAQEKNLLKINFVNIRDFAKDKHKTVDDRPYGGGRGMILKVDVLDQAIQNVKCSAKGGSNIKCRERVILLDPQGKTFSQKVARRLSKFDHLILICGHYEGVDERVRKLVDEEISIGDYILTGGEIPAIVVVDAVARLIPGVLKRKEATRFESFTTPFLEYPQYTRPPVFGIRKVPSVLLSGDHLRIKKWQKEAASKRTLKLRPDLLKRIKLTNGH